MKRITITAALGLALLASCGGDTDDSTPEGDASSDALAQETTNGTDKPEVQLLDIPKGDEDVPECTEDSECDDSKYCNGEETCQPDSIDAGADGCVAGEPVKGNDPNPTDCVVLGECDEETQSFPTVNLGAGDSCDDGIACTTADVCDADGACAGAADDSRCDDQLFCNGVESCNTVVGCLAGEAPTGTDADPGDCLVPGPCEEATQSFTLIPAETGKGCDDGIGCTENDACTGGGTCEGAPNHGSCTDGLFCNGAEECAIGQGCVAGLPPTAPGDEATDDCFVPGPCDEGSDAFPPVPAENGLGCNDGIDCTTDDTCDESGACTGVPQPSLCTDGQFCNGAEECDPVLGCGPGTPPEPPVDEDPDDCLVPSTVCDEDADTFPPVPAEEDSACDDDIACTTDDGCNDAGECLGTVDGTLCDDGLFCNGLETCDAAAGCVDGDPPTPPADTDAADCMAPGAECDEASDSFPAAPANEGGACDDGSACTDATTICTGGVCGGGAEVDCSDTPLEACQVAICDPTVGCMAVTADDGTACDDGSACTDATTICTGGVCGGGAEVDCSGTPLETCQVATCDPTVGCMAVTAEDGTACDDGNPETTGDSCAGGVCSCVPSCVDVPCLGPDGCGGTCMDLCPT